MGGELAECPWRRRAGLLRIGWSILSILVELKQPVEVLAVALFHATQLALQSPEFLVLVLH